MDSGTGSGMDSSGQCLAEHCGTHDENGRTDQEKADFLWKTVNSHLELFLRRTAGQSALQMRCQKRPKRFKGRQKTPLLRQPYDQGAPNLRVLRKLWGRMRELEFRQTHGQQGQQMQVLKNKVLRCQHWREGLTAQEVEEKVNVLERQDKQLRLQHWRAKLRSSDKEAFRWLRSKPGAPSHVVTGPCSGTATEALEKVKQYWRRIWDREDKEGTLSMTEYLERFQENRQPQQVWPPVQTEALRRAAKKQQGKAAGPDGWAGTEVAVACMPLGGRDLVL